MSTEDETLRSVNPRRVQAGRENRMKRGPLTAEGRERLQKSIQQHQPWLKATGPRTPAGKAQAIQNGKTRQSGERSVRERRSALAPIREMIAKLKRDRLASNGSF